MPKLSQGSILGVRKEKTMEVVSLERATEILREYGLWYPVWVTGSVVSGEFQALVCDYRGLPGYTVKFCVAVYRGPFAHLVRRFNVV